MIDKYKENNCTERVKWITLPLGKKPGLPPVITQICMAELLIFLFIHLWGFIFVFLMTGMTNTANFRAITPGIFPKGAQPGAL